MISSKKVRANFTIDESSFETYLNYEKYEDGLFWMNDRVFFMLEIVGGIYYYSSEEDILDYYTRLKLVLKSIPPEANASIQSFFMPYRDIDFDPPPSKSTNSAVNGFYDETVKKIKNAPKTGYYDDKSLLRDMRNFLIVIFPLKGSNILGKIEDVLDQRGSRLGGSATETYLLWKKSFLTSLRSMNCDVTEVDGDDFLYMMFTLLNQDFDPLKLKYNTSIPLKRQLLYNIITTDHHEIAYSKKRWAMGFLENLERVKLGFLVELMALKRPFFFSVTMHSLSTLKLQAVLQGRKRATMNKQKIANIDSALQVSGTNDAFEAEAYMGILLDDYKEVGEVHSELTGFFSKYRWDFQFETSIAADMLRSALPAHFNTKAARRLMIFDDHAISFLNFRNYRRKFSDQGIMFAGEDLSPKMVDIFDSTAYGTMISGGSGSGKTMFSQYMAMSELAQGRKVIIIDPVGNFEGLCEVVDGQYYRIGLSDRCRGMDCFPNLTYAELIQNKEVSSMTLALLEKLITLGSKSMDMSPRAKSVLQKAFYLMYKNTPDPDLTIFVEVLESLHAEAVDAGTDSIAGEFAAALEMFLPDGVYGNLIASDSLDLDAQFIVFDIGELRDRAELAQLAIYGLMTKISSLVMYLATQNQKCILFIDEAHYLIADPGSVSFIKNGVRVWRTYGGSLVLISQQLTDLLENREVGEGIFKTLYNFFILAQSPSSIYDAQEFIGYNDTEANAMTDLRTVAGEYSFMSYYTRGMASDGNPAFGRFYLSIPRYFYWMMTSHPDEKSQRLTRKQHYIDKGFTPLDALHHALQDLVEAEKTKQKQPEPVKLIGINPDALASAESTATKIPEDSA